MSRIIAGLSRGTKLRTPDGQSTRPTTDRVREAFFSALANWFDVHDQTPGEQLNEVYFLDLFAGSGAIGLEAASRGCEQVYLVENGRQACSVIAQNIKTVGLKTAKLVNSSVGAWLSKRPRHGFDVVWMDPPYTVENKEIQGYLTDLSNGWFQPDALVCVERSIRDEPIEWPEGFTDGWSAKYGETILYFARANAEEENQ